MGDMSDIKGCWSNNQVMDMKQGWNIVMCMREGNIIRNRRNI